MKKIFVTSKNKIHKVVKKTGAKHVLSITDVNDLLFITPRLAETNMLQLSFEDVIDEDARHAPTKEHVQTILDWASDIPEDEDIAIHCFAGVSRSSASAIAIKAMKFAGNPHMAKLAVNAIHRDHPHICPNPVITKFADEILGFDGELHKESEKVANALLISKFGNWNDEKNS